MKAEPIAYTSAGKSYEGMLVYDPAAGAKPLVVMGPNWMGVTPAAVETASAFAARGYVVFVIDVYGTGVRPNGPQEAGPLANPLRKEVADQRRITGAALEAAIAAAQARNVLAAGGQVAIGFCFGGGNVLELARSGADLKATVVFHSDLTTPLPAEPGAIKGPVAAFHGAADPVEPKANRDAFEAEMDKAGVNWRLTAFSGVVHSFTDPHANVPGVAKYDATAAQVSLDGADAFLKAALAH